MLMQEYTERIVPNEISSFIMLMDCVEWYTLDKALNISTIDI